MFIIRYSSKSLGQKIQEVHVTPFFKAEKHHSVNNRNNHYELRYFIQLITDTQTSLVLTGEAGWHTGLGSSRRGDWSPGHSQMCLKSSCRSLEQMVRTCASCCSSEFRYDKESWGEGNICNPVADHGAALQMWSFKCVWFVVQVLFHWPASHLICTTSPACGTEPETGQRMITRFSTSTAWGLWFITKILTKWDNTP